MNMELAHPAAGGRRPRDPGGGDRGTGAAARFTRADPSAGNCRHRPWRPDVTRGGKPGSVRNMVQIPVALRSPRDASSPEWVLMELQGEIEARHETGLAGSLMGDLHYSREGVPILIIGHHILYGKVSHLERPFAVLLKHTARRAGAESPKEVQSPTQGINEENTSTCYVVTALIKKKIIFKTRPKPIITNVPKRL
ncbi:chromosome transmission fidelity protein 8 homolog [Pristis pectinata]|uniref:chromosome transmission fidelity protein 8 homolog n=1 Tax=Pristis pectinata TaxID=685728 RepID=UPI00223D9E33|nr:chromosome transmission fidelity protein 8 homolog [Pristis pectinata]